jgi:hypothetical protein
MDSAAEPPAATQAAHNVSKSVFRTGGMEFKQVNQKFLSQKQYTMITFAVCEILDTANGHAQNGPQRRELRGESGNE